MSATERSAGLPLTAPRPRAAGTRPSLARQATSFVLHFLEMCAPMCIGFMVGDFAYLWLAGLFGYEHPFRELPELSVLVVTVTMTVPMVLWMRFRGMPRRATAEMAAAMPVLAVVLLVLGWLAVLERSELALLEHGLMMPAMLVPMVLRLDLYAGRVGHAHHAAPPP